MLGITNSRKLIPKEQYYPNLPALDEDGVLIYANYARIPYVVTDLESCSWSDISTIASAGVAGNYFSVGDTKSVALSGTVGTLSLDTTLYVYIIGINHGGKNGITFQGFKTAATGGTDVALATNHNASSGDGTLNFNMNHWGEVDAPPYGANYGGWKGCDLRYDILGSTDTAPSGYGSAPVVDTRVGYDASTTTATNPVSNTLMAALPSALRAVMRPMTVYTDNSSSSLHYIESYVTTSIDYLPLLAEYEVFGTRTYANEYEQDYQTQYAYYASGASKVKYQHSYTTATAFWWERSPVYNGSGTFCIVLNSGDADTHYSTYSYELAPMFLV